MASSTFPLPSLSANPQPPHPRPHFPLPLPRALSLYALETREGAVCCMCVHTRGYMCFHMWFQVCSQTAWLSLWIHCGHMWIHCGHTDTKYASLDTKYALLDSTLSTPASTPITPSSTPIIQYLDGAVPDKLSLARARSQLCKGLHSL
jgi:hypothetical protein